MRALALERELGFERSCIREVGLLLHVLAGPARTDARRRADGPQRRRPDPVREFWLNHPRIAAVELLTTPRTAVIVGTRSS